MTKDLFKYRYYIASFFLFILTLFTGLRWQTGTDWEPYKTLFDSIRFDYSFLISVYGFDIGYVFFNAAIRLFTENYTVFLLIDSMIAVGLIGVFLCQYSNYPILSVYVFYNAFFVSQFMGSNRRIIAMGAILFFYSTVYMKKRKYQILSGLTAFLFHRSSIINICAYFVPRKRFSLRTTGLSICIAFVLGITQTPFKIISLTASSLAAFSGNPLIEKMLFYSEHGDEQLPEEFDSAMQMSLSVIKRSIFLLFYIWIIKKKKNILDPMTDFFFNLYIVGFVMYLLLNGASTFMMLSSYFTFIEIALISRMWYYASVRDRFCFLSFLFLYGIFQLTSAVSAFPSLYLPYRSILF